MKTLTIIDLKTPDALAKAEEMITETVDALMEIFGTGDQDAICGALEEQINENEPDLVTLRIFQAVIMELWMVAHAPSLTAVN